MLENEQMSEEEKQNLRKDILEFARIQPETWVDAVFYFTVVERIMHDFTIACRIEDSNPTVAGSIYRDIQKELEEFYHYLPKNQKNVEKAPQPEEVTKEKIPSEKQDSEPEYTISTKPIISFVGEDGKRESFYHLATLEREEANGEQTEYLVLLRTNPEKESDENAVVFFRIVRDEETGKIEKYEGVADQFLGSKLLKQYILENEEGLEGLESEITEDMEISGFDEDGNETKYIYHGTLYHADGDGNMIEYVAITPQDPETEAERYAMSFLEVLRDDNGNIEDLIGVVDAKLARELVEQFKREHPNYEI